MVRVVAPLSKLAAGLAPNVTRQSRVYSINAARPAAALAHSVFEIDGNCRNGASLPLSTGRPICPSRRLPTPSRTRHPSLAHTSAFHTTARAASRLDTSTIDFAVLPTTEALYPIVSDDPFARLRVPLAPDNYEPDREHLEGHEPEAEDQPLAAPEIVVLAAHPENVTPAALTEVEGIGLDGVELNFVHDPEPEEREQGMLRDLWEGLVDDVFGNTKSKS